MRFYFQDPLDAQQTTTKCIRVSSTASVRDVVTILIEKFRPDMRLLGSSNYALYEVHGNGGKLKVEFMDVIVMNHELNISINAIVTRRITVKTF